MALVGPITINGKTNNAQWAYKTVVTETAVDPVNKTSTVKVEHFLGRTYDTSFFAGTYSQTFEAGGQTHTDRGVYKSSGDIDKGKFVSMGSHTFVIKQTTTPLTITVKSSYSTSAFVPNNSSATGTVTLSKLHEAPVPSIDDIVEKNTTLTNNGVAHETFVPYLSKKEFKISAATYDNAKVTKYAVHNSTENYTSTSTPITIDFAAKNLLWGLDGNNNPVARFSFSAWDDTGSKGTTAFNSYTVIPYNKPNLISTSSNIKRNGQISGKANLNLTGTFYNGKIGTKNNTITLSFKYWKQGASEPTTYYSIPSSAYTISGNTITISNWNIAKNGTVVTDINKDSIYKFKVKAVDTFNSSTEIELVCPKGEWLMAKFKDRIDFRKITIQGSPISDFVVEQGDNYIKWNSGKLEQWKTIGMNPLNVTTASGNVYVATLSLGNWTIPFVETPTKIIYSVGKMITQRNIWVGGHPYEGGNYGGPSETSAGSVQVYASWSSEVYGNINIYAVGKWK